MNSSYPNGRIRLVVVTNTYPADVLRRMTRTRAAALPVLTGKMSVDPIAAFPCRHGRPDVVSHPDIYIPLASQTPAVGVLNSHLPSLRPPPLSSCRVAQNASRF